MAGAAVGQELAAIVVSVTGVTTSATEGLLLLVAAAVSVSESEPQAPSVRTSDAAAAARAREEGIREEFTLATLQPGYPSPCCYLDAGGLSQPSLDQLQLNRLRYR